MAIKKINEQLLRDLILPSGGQSYIYDSQLPGFGVRLNPGCMTFFSERRIEGTGKTRRITIGRYPVFSVAQARKEAEKIIGELARGHDRKAVERQLRIKSASLDEVLRDFLTSRTLKEKTVASYRDAFNRHFADWSKKPWIEVTSMGVKARHSEVTRKHGPGIANLSMRILSAVLNFAIGSYRTIDDQPLLLENPVRVLGRTHGWNRLKPRTRYIKPSQFAAWWTAACALGNNDLCEVLQLIALTGLRRSEALSLRWSDIDLLAASLTIEETKNGDKHVLPLCPFLVSVLERRRKTTSSVFVFPGAGERGHLVELKRAIARITRTTGIEFSCHDLRRTFAVYANTLEISSYSLKRLLNHRASGDVTYTHYMPLDVERLRDPMNRICDYMLRLAGEKRSADIVAFHKTGP